jgi:hypothetical protein
MPNRFKDNAAANVQISTMAIQATIWATGFCCLLASDRTVRPRRTWCRSVR